MSDFHDGQRLAPGVYAHEGEMHIDAAEMLAHLGLPATAENEAMVERVAARIAAGEDIPLEVVEG